MLSGSENFILPVFFALLMTGIYFLTSSITHNSEISFSVVLAAMFEHLFTDQLRVAPLLDIIQMPFIIFAVLFSIASIEKKKPQFLLIAYVLFAMAMMVKVWLIGAVFVIPVSLYVAFMKRDYIPYIVLGFGITLGITLLCYARLFYDNYSVMQILKVQKWLYWYQAGKQNRLFTIWPLIFLNRWYVWWGDTPISKDPNWSLSWPVVIGGALGAVIHACVTVFKNTGTGLQMLLLCVVSYSIFLSFGQASARYLLLLLPFCYALCGWIVFTVLKSRKVFGNI